MYQNLKVGRRHEIGGKQQAEYGGLKMFTPMIKYVILLRIPAIDLQPLSK